MKYEENITNIVAFLIAQSVTKESQIQSYVNSGPPSCLKDLFDGEKVTLMCLDIVVVYVLECCMNEFGTK